MKKATMKGTKRVVRYAIGSNQVDGEKRSNPRGDYYVMDLLFQRAAETDPTKGWYRKLSTVRAAVKKMNAADNGTYVALPNGYVDEPPKATLQDVVAGTCCKVHACQEVREITEWSVSETHRQVTQMMAEDKIVLPAACPDVEAK